VSTKLAPRVKEALNERWEPVYRSRLHYLVTWSTRGSRPVLKERHARKLQDLIPQLCAERGIELLDVAVGQDHVRVLFGLKPSQSVATTVREIKSRGGLQLLADHPELRVWLGGNLIWDERYAVETVSPVRLPRIEQKLRNIHLSQEPLARAS